MAEGWSRLAEHVFRGRDQHARAAGFAPDLLVGRAGLRPVVITGIQLSIVDIQLAIEQVKFFQPRMCVGWIVDAGIQAYQHADTVGPRITGKDLAVDSRRGLFPLEIRPMRREVELLFGRDPAFVSDSLSETIPERRRRAAFVGVQIFSRRAHGFPSPVSAKRSFESPDLMRVS